MSKCQWNEKMAMILWSGKFEVHFTCNSIFIFKENKTRVIEPWSDAEKEIVDDIMKKIYEDENSSYLTRVRCSDRN